MRQTSSKALPNSDGLCVFAWLPSLLTLPVSATTSPPAPPFHFEISLCFGFWRRIHGFFFSLTIINIRWTLTGQLTRFLDRRSRSISCVQDKLTITIASYCSQRVSAWFCFSDPTFCSLSLDTLLLALDMSGSVSLFRSCLQWLSPASSLAVTLQSSTLVILLWNPASAVLSQHLPPAGRALPHGSNRDLVCLIHLWISSTWHSVLPLVRAQLRSWSCVPTHYPTLLLGMRNAGNCCEGGEVENVW